MGIIICAIREKCKNLIFHMGMFAAISLGKY